MHQRRIDVEMQVYDAPYIYLYYIALAQMSDDELNVWNGYREQEKYQEAYDFAIGTDEFSTEMRDSFKDDNSAEDFIDKYQEIVAYSQDNQVQIPPELQTDMGSLLDQLDVVHQRSEVMVENVLALMDTIESEGPIAVFVGAAHAEYMAELLKERGVSYVVIEALSREEGFVGGLLSTEAYMRKVEGLSVGGENTLGEIFDNRKKPGPTAGKEYTQNLQMHRELFQKLAVATEVAMKGHSPDNIIHAEHEIWEEFSKDEAGEALYDAFHAKFPNAQIRIVGYQKDVNLFAWNFSTVTFLIHFPPDGQSQFVEILLMHNGDGSKTPKTLSEALKNEKQAIKTKAEQEAQQTDDTESQDLESLGYNRNCTTTWYQLSAEQ